MVIEVVCPDSSSSSPLCVKPVEKPTTGTTPDKPKSDTTTITSGDLGPGGEKQIDLTQEISFDYAPPVLTPIEEKVAPPDSSLEDESNFVDVIGVLSPEQAADTIESIIVASNKII